MEKFSKFVGTLFLAAIFFYFFIINIILLAGFVFCLFDLYLIFSEC